MSVNLDRIVQVDITRATRTISRRSWGTVLIAAYHTAWADRVREYEDPADMLTDGFTSKHPAYLAAVALCSQSPRPRSFKIGRRLGTPDQTVRITPATPTAAEVFGITIGGVRFEITADATPSVAEVCAAFTLLINADADALIASGVNTAATVQNISGAQLNGVIGDDAITPARNVTLTLTAHADWNATTIVVTGTDSTGRVITENFAVPDGGDTTLTGTKYFASITNVMIPAQGGIGGALTMGVGGVFGDNPDLDVTATDNTTSFSVSADDTGAWFGYDDRTANLRLEDLTTEPATTLAVDLGGIRSADQDWYGLIVGDAQSDLQIVAAAAWAETQIILHGAMTFDSEVEDATDVDILSQLRDASYFRTLPFYTRDNASRFPIAAAFGAIFALDVGSASFAFKTLSGVEVEDLSSTVVTRIIGTPESPSSGKRGLIYVEARATGTNAGIGITLGGLTSGGEWADVIMGIDFVRATIQERAFNTLLGSPKVPFTDDGIDTFSGAVRGALNLAASDRYRILDPTSIVVEAATLAETDVADRQARYYDGITWDARVQGAIHALRIRGTVRP